MIMVVNLGHFMTIRICTNSTCKSRDFVALIALTALTRLQSYQGYLRGAQG